MAENDAVFVLWGEGCDEALAVAWVSRLRAEGRRVYLVGVSGRRNRGSYGVSVAPDIGLDEALALADQTALVIVPCAETVLDALRRDPRFDKFLACTRGVLAQPQAVESLAGLLAKVLVIPTNEESFYEETLLQRFVCQNLAEN